MVKRKVVISERDNIATLFEGDKAIEFIINRGEMLLGDVYLAEVENILPSIDAAFVNVGSDKMGFLHSSDVQGKGELKTRLHPKQRVIVQVMKEPTGHKGPRVTTNLSLPGRFLVLMPESKGVSISRKIETQAERSRLKSVCSLLKSSGVGVIIRTEAQGQSETDIQEDFEVLMERWQNIVAMADAAKPPNLLYRDQDLLYRVIREMVTEDVDELIVDTSFGTQRAQQLLQNWNLDKSIKVTQYTGQVSIMVAKGVEREIRAALQTKVPLPSGGYLYIQPTEALCVVDVNSGRFTSLQSQADTIRITNLESAKEIARQLRLRNIGGMIVVDFIDMDARADKLAVLQAFETELSPDKAKPQVGQLTDLGLVEMTRHRQGQALSEIFGNVCPVCSGSGQSNGAFNWASTSAELPDYRSTASASGSRRSSGGGSRGGRSSSTREGSGTSTYGSGGRSSREGRNSGTDTATVEANNKLLTEPAKIGGRSSGLLEDEEFAPSSARSRYGSSSREGGRGSGSRRSATPEAVSLSSDAPLETRRRSTGYSSVAEVAPKPEGFALLKTTAEGGVQTAEQALGTVDGYDYYQHFLTQQVIAFGVPVASSLLFSYPPRTAHNWLCKLNGKSTHVLTILHSLKSQWHTHEDTDEDNENENALSQDDEMIDNEGATDEPNGHHSETSEPNNLEDSDESADSSFDVTPQNEEKSLTSIVEDVVKPVLMNRLAEQLLSRSVASNPEEVASVDPVPALIEAQQPLEETVETAGKTEVHTLVNEVVSTLVEALEADKSPEAQEAVSKQFLVNYLGKLPTAESLLAQTDNQLEATFEASLPGYPEMPALLFEGENEEPLPWEDASLQPEEQPVAVEVSELIVFEQPAEETTSPLEVESTSSEEETVTASDEAEDDQDEYEETDEDDDEEEEEGNAPEESTPTSTALPAKGTSPKPKPKKNVPRSKRVKKNTGKGKK
ncbi:MAG: Rne/Rng family ribonuclease [Vampirovibrio sp.]|nr:Rne/Rng family ribonuclease [Vampirovibrio sp.]